MRPSSRMILAALALIGCSRADAREQLVTVDTLPGGIPVTMTSAPIDSGRWALVHERDVMPDPGSSGELIHPQDLALADDGTLYVVEQDPATIRVYGPSGQYLRSIGRSGSGPGEFQVGFIAVSGNRLFLQDPVASRGTVWDLTTDSVLSIRPTGCCFWVKVFTDGSGRAVITMLTQDDPTAGPGQRFIRVPIDGGVGDTVFVARDPAAADELRWAISEEGRMLMGVTVPLAPRPYETVDPTGSFVTGWSASYRIRRSRDGLDTTAIFGRPVSPTPVADAERSTLVDDRVAQMLGNGMEFDEPTLRRAFDPGMIPAQRPAFDRLHVDGAGRTWVRLSSSDTLQVHLDLFDPQGRWLDQLTVAHRPWATSSFVPLSFSRDHLAVLGEDDEGLPVISIFRIERMAE